MSNNDVSKISNQKQTVKDQQIAELQNDLEYEKDQRKEERFAWVIVSVILVDILLLGPMTNPVTPIGIFVLELIALLIFARRSGIDYVAVLLDKLIGSVTKRLGKDD